MGSLSLPCVPVQGTDIWEMNSDQEALSLLGGQWGQPPWLGYLRGPVVHRGPGLAACSSLDRLPDG